MTTNYQRLSDELQALVHQLILIQSQKGDYPLSAKQMSDIVDNVYGVMLGGKEAEPVINQPQSPEEALNAKVEELKKLHPSAEIITSELEMYDLKGSEWDKPEHWQYSGVSHSKAGLTYTIYTSNDQKNTWAIRRNGKGLFICLEKGIDSVPFEALAQIFEQYAK